MASVVGNTANSSKKHTGKEKVSAESEGRSKRVDRRSASNTGASSNTATGSGKLLPRPISAGRGRGSAASRSVRGRGRGKILVKRGGKLPHGELKRGVERTSGINRSRQRSRSRSREASHTRSSSANRSAMEIGDAGNKISQSLQTHVQQRSTSPYPIHYLPDLIDLPDPEPPAAFYSEMGFHFRFELPYEYGGLLIGKHGIFAKKMFKEFNVQLSVRTTGQKSVFQWVTLLGPVVGVKAAMDTIVSRFPRAPLPIISDEQVEYYMQLQQSNSSDQNIRITVGNERYEGPGGDGSPERDQPKAESNQQRSKSDNPETYKRPSTEKSSLDSRKPRLVADNENAPEEKHQHVRSSRWDSPERSSARESSRQLYSQRDTRRFSPRKDSPRRVSPRRYSPRRASPRRESAKSGAPIWGSPRRGSPRMGSPRMESPKRGSPRPESPNRRFLKRGSPRRRSPKQYSPQRSSHRMESPQREIRRESPRGDFSRRDSPHRDYPRRDFQRDLQRSDSLRRDSPQRTTHYDSSWGIQQGSQRQQEHELGEREYMTPSSAIWDYSKQGSLHQEQQSLKRPRSQISPDSDSNEYHKEEASHHTQQKRSQLADIADMFKNRDTDDLPEDPYLPIQEARSFADRISAELRDDDQQNFKPLPGLDSIANVDDEDRYLYGDDIPSATAQTVTKPAVQPALHADSTQKVKKPASSLVHADSTQKVQKPASSLVPDYDVDEEVESTAKHDMKKTEEPYDPTIENILKSIGFNFKMSKQMQEQAMQSHDVNGKKKVAKADESVEGYGIDRASSFLSTGIKDVDIGTVLKANEKDANDVVQKSGGRPASVQREESYEDRAKRYRAEQIQAYALGHNSPPFDGGRRAQLHDIGSPKQRWSSQNNEDIIYSGKQEWQRSSSLTSTSHNRYADDSPVTKQGQYKDDKPTSKYREAGPVQKKRHFTEASPVTKRGSYEVSPKREKYRDSSPSSHDSGQRHHSPKSRHHDVSPRRAKGKGASPSPHRGDAADSRSTRHKSPAASKVDKSQHRSPDAGSDRRSSVSRRSRSWSLRSRDRSLSPRRRSPRRRSPSPLRRGRSPLHRRFSPLPRGNSPRQTDTHHSDLKSVYQTAKIDDPMVYTQPPPPTMIPPPPVHLPPPGYPVPPSFYDWNYAFPPPPPLSSATSNTFYGQQFEHPSQLQQPAQEWPAVDVNLTNVSNLRVVKEAYSEQQQVSAQPKEDDVATQLSRLEHELSDLQRQQNEMMRRKQRERDGHRDPLIADNAALQHDIYEQIAVLHRKNNHHLLADAAMEKANDLKVVKNQKAAGSSQDVKKQFGADNANFEYFDAGNHWCPCCNSVSGNIFELFVHLLSKKHQQAVDPYNRPWVNDFPKMKKEKAPNAQTVVAPMKGIEFMMATQAFYCRLCCKFVGDAACAEDHLKSDDHNDKYTAYIKENQFYERRFNLDRAAGLSRMRSEPEEKEVLKSANKSPPDTPRARHRSPSPEQTVKRRESLAETKKDQEKRRELSDGAKRKTSERDDYREKRARHEVEDVKKEKRSVMVEHKRQSTSDRVFEEFKSERAAVDKVRAKEKQAISIKLVGRSQGKVIGSSTLNDKSSKEVKTLKTPPAVQSGPVFPLRKKTKSTEGVWKFADRKAPSSAIRNSGNKPTKISTSDQDAVTSAAIASAFSRAPLPVRDVKKPPETRKSIFKPTSHMDMFTPVGGKKTVTPPKTVTPFKAAMAAGRAVNKILAKSMEPSEKPTAKVQSKPASDTQKKTTSLVTERGKINITVKTAAKEPIKAFKSEVSAVDVSKPDVKRDVVVESDDDAKSDASLDVGSDFEVLDECNAD